MLKLVIVPGTHVAVLDQTFSVCLHAWLGKGRMSGAPEDCPKIVTSIEHTEVVPFRLILTPQVGATFKLGTALEAQAVPVPPGPDRVALNTVLEAVAQEALPLHVSVAAVQLSGAAGVTVGFPLAIPLVRLTVRSHCAVVPTRLAVILHTGFGTASTRAEEHVNCPPGPSTTALKSKLLFAAHTKLGNIRLGFTELSQGYPCR